MPACARQSSGWIATKLTLPRISQRKSKTALREARLLVPIISLNWIQSAYCVEELERFVAGDTSRLDDIVRVQKQETPEVPELLRNREGYRFFAAEPSGRIREFYWRGLKDQAAYNDTLKRIAERIVDRLMARPHLASAAKQGKVKCKKRVIFLAAPSDELRDAWQRLANDLDGAGFTVVPVGGRLPDTAANAESEIRAALAAAEISVHFLGESEGATPNGGGETYSRLQLRIAREHAGARPGFERILWAPKWLPGRQADKRDPFEVVDRFGPLRDGENVFAEEVTNLSQWLRLRLDPLPPNRRLGACSSWLRPLQTRTAGWPLHWRAGCNRIRHRSCPPISLAIHYQAFPRARQLWC
jgi:hypothetical protein